MADMTKPVQKARGSYAKSAAKRAAILNAALEVFAVGGYRAGSLREIADRVGMKQPNLFHYFQSKGALLADVLELRDDRALEISPLNADEPVEAVRGLIRLMRYNASIPGIVRLHTTVAAEAVDEDHPAHAYMVRRYESSVTRFSAVLRGCREVGALRQGVDPEQAARGIIAMMDGLQVQWLLQGGALDMAGDLETYLRSLVDLGD